jgi:hypothetical protein
MAVERQLIPEVAVLICPGHYSSPHLSPSRAYFSDLCQCQGDRDREIPCADCAGTCRGTGNSVMIAPGLVSPFSRYNTLASVFRK